ncbi:hypothetical protein [Desulfonatronum parangueonense]
MIFDPAEYLSWELNHMFIEITENDVLVGVEFSLLNREKDFKDDIKISLSETCPKDQRKLFHADQVSLGCW